MSYTDVVGMAMDYKDSIEDINSQIAKATTQKDLDELASKKKLYEALAKEAENDLKDKEKNIDEGNKAYADGLEKDAKAKKEAKEKEDKEKEKDAKYALDKAQREQDALSNIAGAASNSFTNFYQDLISGTVNIGGAFDRMGREFGITISSMIVQALAFKAIMAGLDAIGLGGVADWLFNNSISSVPSGISAPTGISTAAISQNLSNSNYNNNNAVIESNNKTTNAIYALNKTLIQKDLSINIAPTLQDLDVVKQKINPTQKRVNRSGFKV
jgi:hypothetical protein